MNKESMASDVGHTGNALEVSFDYHGCGGWAAFHREAQLQLPDNCEISFWLKHRVAFSLNQCTL